MIVYAAMSKIAFEHVRHEETAAFAAGAEASLTHKLNCMCW